MRDHLIISLVILAVFLCINGVWTVGNMTAKFLLLADGLTVTGVLFMLYSFLLRIWRGGYFDFLGYTLYVARYLLANKKVDGGFLNYYDYKSGIEYGHPHIFPPLIVGIVLFSAGLLLVLLFSTSLCQFL